MINDTKQKIIHALQKAGRVLHEDELSQLVHCPPVYPKGGTQAEILEWCDKREQWHLDIKREFYAIMEAAHQLEKEGKIFSYNNGYNHFRYELKK